MKLSSLQKSLDKAITNSSSRKANSIEQQLWQPQPGPQTEAFNHQADECLFGGAAGGGKSALLIILATLSHKRSIIFRREYPRLKDVIEKSRKVLTGIARYNSNEKIWRGIPGDRTLEFGAVQHEDTKEAWRGIEHDLKAFDELGEFSREQYEFLITWNRSSDPNVRCRAIATCNPPSTEEAEWIKDYWAAWLKPEHPNPAAPGEIRWYVSIEGEEKEVPSGDLIEHKGEMIMPRSRTFIPASLNDNAYLRDSNYRGNLQRLPEPLRSQLLYGDFSISVKVDDAWQVIPSAWVDAAMKRWQPKPPSMQTHLGVDVARGGKDETVIVPRHHHWVGPLICLPGELTPNGDKVGEQILIHRKNPKAEIRIDIVGVGCSVYDYIKREGVENVISIHGGAGSELMDQTQMLRFYNLRSQMWWQMRELLDPANNQNIALPNDPLLRKDLTTPRWRISPSRHKHGEIRVESKEDIIKRLGGRSPDRGDALIYAFCEGVKDDAGYEWLEYIDR